MSDLFSPFDESQLSPEELEILRRFDELEDASPDLNASANLEVDPANLNDLNLLLATSPEAELPSPAAVDTKVSEPILLNSSDEDFLEDMLSVFAFEADEDIRLLRRTLRQAEEDETLDVVRFTALQRIAHKIKGTAGAVGCFAMSTIAYHIEAISRLVINGMVDLLIGQQALVHAVIALEVTLDGLIVDRQEHPDALEELETEYKALGIEVTASGANAPAQRAGMIHPVPSEASPSSPEHVGARKPAHTVEEPSFLSPSIRVDTRRFEQLLQHSEQLGELQAPLEQAQAQVEVAMKELQAAQARLRHLETIISTVTLTPQNERPLPLAAGHELPASSLVARILNEATARTGHLYQHHNRLRSLAGKSSSGTALWDELEIEHYTESEVLAQQISEAIADIVTASSQLRLAFAGLHAILQKHKTEAANVRSDTLLLRLTPLSALLSRLQRAVLMSARAQSREVSFEVAGETVEIDQDILEELKNPLLQLVRSCVTESVPAEEGAAGERDRVWLHVQALGHEIAIEVGFSMPVPGGALDTIYETMLRLNGRISAHRNATGGVSFYIHLPRSQGTVQGLLVRAGRQQVVVPFSQLQRIDYGRQAVKETEESGATGEKAAPAATEEQRYYFLNDLLRFPSLAAAPSLPGTDSATVRPVLVLQTEQSRLLVEVEEILGSTELVVKPLASHLRRPGITGTAIDGMGNVLLLLNVPDLVRRYRLRTTAPLTDAGEEEGDREQRLVPLEAPRRRVLVADDSVFIRQSLLHGLSQAGYQVEEAHDGMEALEKLLASPQDVLVLDIEMPNLNGYDLLSILHAYPEIAGVKIIMLTSRLSEKHETRARELGAHAYLTKPCPQQTLLNTIETVLSL